jgi:uncharacterized membrane protein YkoI
MKINRFVALAAIALLVVGAMGVVAARSFAQTPSPTTHVQATAAPGGEEAVGADTDNVEEQVGDQNQADAGNVEEQVGDQNQADTDNVEEQVGDQSQADTGTGDNGQDAVPSGTPAITAEQARATAEAYLNAGTATQVEVDDENGQLVYSVEIGGTDVKVDAMTGAVLGTETGQD